MSSNNLRYIFSGRFDNNYLDELYGNDIYTMMEIFETSIYSLTTEVNKGMYHYQHGDLESLRKVFHKIKPLFGYVGLPSLQEYVHDFENKCGIAANVDQIRRDYENIIGIISDTVHVLSQELSRMTSYTNVKVS